MQILMPPIVVTFVLIGPISLLVVLVIALAASGTTLGIRKMYVKALLKIFEVN